MSHYCIYRNGILGLTKDLPSQRNQADEAIHFREIMSHRSDLVSDWLAIQNETWEAETGRRIGWNRAWFQREFSDLGTSQRLWLRDQGPGSFRHPVASIGIRLIPPATPPAYNRFPTAQIRWLAVHPQCQRQGIGRRLLAWAEWHAWRCGCQQTQLDSLALWHNALALYQQAGYQPLESARHR